jgi:hypothetical protein
VNIDLHRHQPAENFGSGLLLVAFIGWIGLFAYVGLEDTSTIVALVVLLLVYLGLAAAGIVWRSQANGQFDLTREALQEDADNHSVPHEVPKRLPPNVAQELVEALRDDPSHPLHPPAFLTLGQGVLISLGLAGTFYGLTAGLMGSVDKLSGDQAESALGMSILLGGAKLAFSKSLAGVVFAMVWGFYHHHLLRHRDCLFAALLRSLEESHPALSQEELLVRMITEQRLHREALEGRLVALESGNQERADALNELHRESRGLVDGRLAALANGQQAQVRIITEQQHRIAETVDARLNAIWTRQQAQVEQLGEVVETSRLQAIQAIVNAAEALAGRGETLGLKLKDELLHPDDGVLVEIRDKGQRIIELLDSSQAPASLPAAAPSGVLPSLSQLSADLQRLSSAEPDGLPALMGDRVTSGLHNQLSAIEQALHAISSSSSKAVGDTIGKEVTQEVGNLKAALTSLTAALGALPEATKKNFEDSVGNLTIALKTSRELATGLVDAGSAVQVALKDVSTPITEAKDSLVEVKNALDKVATKLQTEADKVVDAANKADTATKALTFANETTRTVTTETEQSLEQTRKVAESTREEVAKEFEVANRRSRELQAEVDKKTAEAQEALTKALQEGSDRLSASAAALTGAMRESAKFSTEIATNLSTAKIVTETIASTAAEAQGALKGAASPLKEASEAISRLPVAINTAQTALGTNITALNTLLETIEVAQTKANNEQKSAAEQSRELRDQYARLLNTLPSHLENLAKANENIERAWKTAHDATKAGSETNVRLISNYAKAVENALRLPGDLRSLNETNLILASALKDLNAALDRLNKTETRK